jgi:hypothetical protein
MEFIVSKVFNFGSDSYRENNFLQRTLKNVTSMTNKMMSGSIKVGKDGLINSLLIYKPVIDENMNEPG